MSYFEGQLIKNYDCDAFLDLLAKCFKITLDKDIYDKSIPRLIYFDQSSSFYSCSKLNTMKSSFNSFTNYEINTLNISQFVKDILVYERFYKKKRSVKFRKKIINRIYRESKKQIRVKCNDNSKETVNSVYLIKSIINTIFLSFPKKRIPKRRFEDKLIANASSSEKEYLLKNYSLNGTYYELSNIMDNEELKMLQYLLISLLHK